MSKRKENEEFGSSTKKKRSQFKKEWLTEFLVDTTLPHASGRKTVAMKEIFEYSDTDNALICSLCRKAGVNGEWSTGKTWSEWKIDYLKRHLNHNSHLEAVQKLHNQSRGFLMNFLKETPDSRNNRIEYAQRYKSSPEEVNILIDNILLAVKLNLSMLSVQEFHNHMAKYVKIPDSWRSKNYAFEFLDCINAIVKRETFTEIRRSPFHTLIIDESTDISVSKMLIIYIKFRRSGSNIHETVFAGIKHLTACDSTAIVDAIKQFYSENDLDFSRMVMFTSDGASVMLGKHNGVAAKLRQSVPHLLEQHCVAHREDLGIDDAWKTIPFMKEIETLIRTVYTIFSRSSVRKAKLEDIANAADSDVISFKAIHDVRWLSRHFAVSAVVRNYDILLEYCQEQVEEDNDPVHKYCLTKLSNLEFKVALFILCDVLEELGSLCKLLQKSCLAPLDAFQFTKAKLRKLRSQYLGEKPHFNENVETLISSCNSVIKTDHILTFITQTCDHMDKRFPDNELEDWRVFDKDCISNPSNLEEFTFGNEQFSRLSNRYFLLMNKDDEHCFKRQLISEYSEFKYIIAEKVKAGAIQTLQEMYNFAQQHKQFSGLNALLDVCGTFQASSADCERGFSLMNAIKTKTRNKLRVEHLECLIRIKLYLATGNNVNIDSVYNFWKSEKGRREQS
uniref:E3 SUMO-protein ligase KIAA1586-like n=1 Tax=Geotrypetes seraphini TaxID=260995 RepID=A0A6P8SIA4_GEOSA|nr:E3 SUMO-protein ligase KIAA1586-like [Geotrypetes seraphini]